MGTAFQRLHPAAGFLYFLTVIILLVTSMHPVFLLIGFGTGLFYLIVSLRLEKAGAVSDSVLPLGKTVRALPAVCLPAAVFTLILRPLLWHRGVTVLFYVKGGGVTAETLAYGAASLLLFANMLLWMMLLQPCLSAEKILFLFGRTLPRLGVLLSMTLRFLPLLVKRYDTVRDGQTSLPHSVGKELSIVLAWSLEGAIETADSMEARGYGNRRRTCALTCPWKGTDTAVVLYTAVFGGITAAAFASGAADITFYPAIRCAGHGILYAAGIIAWVLLLILPAAADLTGEYHWKKYMLKT